MANTRTVRQALTAGADALRAHRCDDADPARESEALLAFALGVSREKLFALFNEPMPARAAKKFDASLERRRAHTPLAWLLGTAWFMGREFEVTPDTLIPRAATESVVEAALAHASWQADAAPDAAEIVDVGCGSGCIGITLALAMPRATLISSDLSIPACSITRHNAKRHGVFSRLVLRKTNLLGYEPVPDHDSIRPLPLSATAPALMVANLPYLPEGMPVSPCVAAEPPSALFGGTDGLDPSRALLGQLQKLRAKHPAKPITLAYEILAKQFVPLAAAMKAAFPGAKPERIKNHQGVTVGLIARL